MNNPQTTFAQQFDSIKSTTEFNSEWSNGTGYLDGIVHDQSVIDEMGVGERVKFSDDIDNAVNEHINVAHLVERVCGGGRRRTA